MPSRTSSNAKPKPLSDKDLEQIAAEIEAGRPPMVWFTAAAVGVTEGRSGKVVSLGDPADGDFLQIRPTGSKDVLSFGPTEVTLAKPPRDRPVPAPAPKTVSEPKPAPETKEAPVPTAASQPASAAVTKTAAEPKPAPAPRTTPAPAKAAKAPAARKTKAPEVVVTINGTAEGEWTVDVTSGKKRTARAVPVSGPAVAQAAKLLHPEVAEVVEGLLESVRGAQEAKVQQLQAELEQARKLLEELSD
ncbi:DUF6319 family protein [Nocardia carnea]|uniref:DUF6319 family protein n=1 Tax=Nocardia carnea TaxID=37328 RepID=UPI0024565341|nr:DUF6319 family protein [Nocardia carnea]